MSTSTEIRLPCATFCNTNLGGFAQFVVLMIVIWWAWTGETFYQNRYVADDLLHRCLVFLQMFAIATLGMFGVGAKKLFEAVIEHPGEALYPPYRLLYMGAVALYLVALALIEYGTREIGWRLIAMRLIGAALVVLFGLVATTLDPIGFVIPIAVVMVAQVVEGVLIRRPAEEAAHATAADAS